MNIRLIGLGIAVLFILIVVFAGLQKRRRQQRYQPSVGEIDILEQPDDGILNIRRLESRAEPQLNLAEATTKFAKPVSNQSFNQATACPTKPTSQIKPANVKTTGITVIHLLARAGTQFAGYELLQALLSRGLRYGEMNIFHRHEHSNGNGRILFSLASATEPGTFDIQKMRGFTCNGLSLFMRHSGDVDRDDTVYDVMMETAEKLSQELSGDLYDAERRPLAVETE